LAAGNNLGALPVNRNTNNEFVSTGVFWAYDQKNQKKGKREFEKTWGDVLLTDFWGVSSKASQYATVPDEVSQSHEGSTEIYESEIEDFLKGCSQNGFCAGNMPQPDPQVNVVVGSAVQGQA
jgi:hypothetical protein